MKPAVHQTRSPFPTLSPPRDPKVQQLFGFKSKNVHSTKNKEASDKTQTSVYLKERGPGRPLPLRGTSVLCLRTGSCPSKMPLLCQNQLPHQAKQKYDSNERVTAQLRPTIPEVPWEDFFFFALGHIQVVQDGEHFPGDVEGGNASKKQGNLTMHQGGSTYSLLRFLTPGTH